MVDCFVCEYRQTFEDGPNYPVLPACMSGLSIYMECGDCPVCWEHVQWLEHYDIRGTWGGQERYEQVYRESIESILEWMDRPAEPVLARFYLGPQYEPYLGPPLVQLTLIFEDLKP